jgi:hypothetical protein
MSNFWVTYRLKKYLVTSTKTKQCLQEIYYIPGVKKCIAKGKLIDRYRNKRRKLRNCGLLQKRLKFDDTVPTSASAEFQSGIVHAYINT